MNELILYTSDDGNARIHLRTEGESVWLNQLETAEQYNPETALENLRHTHERIYISRHFKNDTERREKLFELYQDDLKVCVIFE